MRTRSLQAMLLIFGVLLFPSSRVASAQDAAPAADETLIQADAATQEAAQADAAATPVPSRVRGFNTGQLLDWLKDDGTPKADYVTCPVATTDVGRATRFGCTVALIGASGSTLQRLAVFWSDLQPDNAGQFEDGWRKYQAVLDALAHFGVTQVIVTPLGSPNWARHPERRTPMSGFQKFAHPDLEFAGDWSNFLAELARHVTPIGFEIGNEQNTNNFWDPIKTTMHEDETPSPTDYATLYCAAVEGISRVDPAARIGNGGRAPIRHSNPDGLRGDKTMEAREFVQKSFAAGVGGPGCRLNFVGYHPYLTNDYCRRTSENMPIQKTAGIVELDLLHTAMTNVNRRQKIWITEWGFPSRPYPKGGTICNRYSAAEQARLIKLEHNYLARLSYTAYSGYFNLVDDDSPNQNGSIGLVCSNFTVKRSFNTWKQLRPAAPGGPLATGACRPGVPAF
jgi:hypothetical protein